MILLLSFLETWKKYSVIRTIFRGFPHHVQFWLSYGQRGHEDFCDNDIFLGVRPSYAADYLFLLTVTEIYSHSRENAPQPSKQQFCAS